MKRREIVRGVVAGLALLIVSTVGSFFVVAINNPTITSETIRERSYSSLADLASASSVVVTVRADSTKVVAKSDLDGFSGPSTTTTSSTVIDVLGLPGGIKLPGPAPVAGQMIQVVQFGVPESLGASALKPGSTYMLFLTPTLIKGSSTDDYLPVGTWAGIYFLSEDGSYTRLVSELDELPEHVTAEEVERALTELKTDG